MVDENPHRSELVPDERVRELVLAGQHREAANLVLARFSPELRPFLYRLLGDFALADEAHSRTCERLWKALPRFRWECSLRSWTYVVARREASRCRARQAKNRVQQTTLSAAEELPATPTLPSLSTTRQDQLESLRASLSDEDRDLLMLRIEQKLAWKEIALAFEEDEEPDAAAVERGAARLRQRFRAIRVTLSSAIAQSDATPRGKP